MSGMNMICVSVESHVLRRFSCYVHVRHDHVECNAFLQNAGQWTAMRESGIAKHMSCIAKRDSLLGYVLNHLILFQLTLVGGFTIHNANAIFVATKYPKLKTITKTAQAVVVLVLVVVLVVALVVVLVVQLVVVLVEALVVVLVVVVLVVALVVVYTSSSIF